MVSCSYCGREAELVDGTEVYPHRPDLSDKKFYRCEPCAAWVGCHPGTDRPLGRLANAELRRAKMAAHQALDPLWRSGRMSRSQAYDWLARQLGLHKSECHVGKFDVETCNRVVMICAEET